VTYAVGEFRRCSVSVRPSDRSVVAKRGLYALPRVADYGSDPRALVHCPGTDPGKWRRSWPTSTS